MDILSKEQGTTLDDDEDKVKSMPLLEQLRQRLVVVDPCLTDQRAWQKMNLIIQHRQKFPQRIREAIDEAAHEFVVLAAITIPFIFLEEIYETIKLCFFRRRSSSDENDEDNDENDDATEYFSTQPKPPLHWWHGPNCDVDTLEEIELAIRFFPQILTEKYYHPLFSRTTRHIPISVCFYCHKAMPFIPLLASLGTELGKFTKAERGGLTCLFQSVFVQLICNVMRKDGLDNDAAESYSPRKRDKASAAIMLSLKKKGLMKKEDIYNFDLTNLLLYNAMDRQNYCIEERFRFLIRWDPSILKQCGRSKPLLCHYVSRLCEHAHDKSTPKGASERFQKIFEFGMLYFPSKLGFLFSNQTFALACDKFGHAEVSTIIDRKLFCALEQENGIQRKSRNTSSHGSYLQTLIIAAACNDEISLDGLYTLFRLDPMALLSPRRSCSIE